MTRPDISGYRHAGSLGSYTTAYLLPTVCKALAKVLIEGRPKRVLDLGCGSGSVASWLVQQGYEVVGVDPSRQGIDQAKKNFPGIIFEVASSETDLAANYGRFRAVVSLEVIEHVYAPREFGKRLFDLLEAGGVAVISTPYHGYLKNLVMALTGRLDAHFTALWDNGHIKFWSVKTLSQLLHEAGFTQLRFHRVGRFGPLAKSLVAVARRHE